MKRTTSILQRAINVLKKGMLQHALIRLKGKSREDILQFIHKQGWHYDEVAPKVGILGIDKLLPQKYIKKLEQALNCQLHVYVQSTNGSLETKTDIFYKNTLLHSVLGKAYQLRASDIYLTVYSEKAVLKFKSKRDWVGHETLTFNIGEHLLKSFLVLAHLNFDITRRPQEGHFRYEYENKILFCRLSYLASSVTQSLVLRLLSEDLFPFSIKNLGLPNNLLNFIDQELESSGMILISGATGSGKTTTLYALGKLLCQKGLKIISLEDPIEAEIDDWTQTEVDTKAGYTFENGLKAILRQDPNVILIGEIRDNETAKAAFYACLSGYLVVTTLHTQHIERVAMRCRELGIDFNLFKDNIQLQIHQSWDDNTKNNSPNFQWIATRKVENFS